MIIADAAPRLIVVAAPNALIVVAVAFKSAKVAEGVVRLVVMAGEVANTNNPLPVSSLITPANSALVVAAKADNLFDVNAAVPVAGIVRLKLSVAVSVKVFATVIASARVAAAALVSVRMLVAGGMRAASPRAVAPVHFAICPVVPEPVTVPDPVPAPMVALTVAASASSSIVRAKSVIVFAAMFPALDLARN